MKQEGPIQIFENEQEAYDYAKKWLKRLSLSYIPEDRREDVISDAYAHIQWEICCERVSWASSDIGNRLEELVGQQIVEYLEWENTGERIKNSFI